MTPEDYLKSNDRSAVPAWLTGYRRDSTFKSSDFFNSRVVFYPGSGTDGHAVKVFGSSHAAHCFVYVDFMLSEADIRSALDSTSHRFKGYKTVARQSVRQNEIGPLSWVSHATEAQRQMAMAHFRGGPPQGFGMFEVLERDERFDDSHGPKRLAILFLGADGHAAYDALFCQEGQKPPYGVLLQDHGFGGNYCEFGEGGVMHDVASRTNSFPKYLLVSSNTRLWPGYELVDGLEATHGGWASFERRLYVREVEGG